MAVTGTNDYATASLDMFSAMGGEKKGAAIVPTTGDDKDVEKILEKHKKMKALKAPWLQMYTRIGQLVYTRKQNFNGEKTDGMFLTGKIYESAPATANHQMASSLIGALWSNAEKSFEIRPARHIPKKLVTQELKEWYEKITKIMAAVIAHPKAGFLLALDEYMLDQGAFGTSGIAVLENEDLRTARTVPVTFKAVDAKGMCIDVGANSFVNCVYLEFEYTVSQCIEEFGWYAVSDKVRDLWAGGKRDDKIKIVHAIEPRVVDPRMRGVMAMPFKSCYVESENKHKIKESGYEEMPVLVSRFWLASGETYGRSPAMEAMPDIIEANALRQAAIIATEKMLNPPLLVSDEVNGVVDTRAGGLTYKRTSARLGSTGPAVEQMITIGEMQTTFKRIMELREIIFNAFFIDRLLDLNNETRMTYGEAQIRNDLRGQSLGSIYARQISELFTPMIERVFNILLDKGYFGVPRGGMAEQELLMQGIQPEYIPDELVKLMLDGDDVYEVTFISPAARIMQNEEVIGIQRFMDFVVNAAKADPSALDNVDMDAITRRYAELVGVMATLLRSPEEVDKIRADRAKAQAAAQQMEMQQIQAETMKSASQAAAFQAKAQQGGSGVQLAAAA